MIRVPTATEYAQLPFEERMRLVAALRALRISWALTELAAARREP